MHRLRNVPSFAVWFACLMGSSVAAQVPEQAQSVEELFERAVEAEGQAYADIRDAILLRGTTAVRLLEQMRASDDRNRRIVAHGMLSWAREPETNRRRQELLRVALVISIRIATGPLHGIMSGELAPGGTEEPAEDMMRLGGPFAPPLGQDELRQDSASPFLLELIIKGAIGPPSFEETERAAETRGEQRKIELVALGRNPNYQLWARCYAAVLVGRLRHPDVVPVLTGLLRASNHPELRACATAGLRNTRSVEGVAPLIDALSDLDPRVREGAFYALRDITGQDFGQDQEKYREWWEKNGAELLKSVQERTK